ncbi:hypothetical protein BDV95DRAFT_577970 [Massariosphaeria phaeospora]|uniref:Uncharacterized protein n=1 Tax=Massariosphaeria phaeospora TaxID=100035 RepID=A0A7C8M5H6_9PLEO|nr:hypothetical protein BDV95DRAFT_577970 [Massariosphaeria phaeospora]
MRSDMCVKPLEGQWKEVKDNKVELADEDPCVFEMYIHLVHAGQTPSELSYHDQGIQSIDTEDQPSLKGKRLINDTRTTTGSPSRGNCPRCILYVSCQKITPSFSPMRRLLVGLYTSCGEGEALQKETSTLSIQWFELIYSCVGGRRIRGRAACSCGNRVRVSRTQAKHARYNSLTRVSSIT